MRNKKPLFFLLGAALSCGALFSYAATEKLFRIALFRDGTKGLEKMKNIRKKISGFFPDQRFLKALEESGHALEESGARETSCRSKDGLLLIGHYLPAKNPKRLIIAMHGWRSHWARDFGMIAPFWQRSGCSILFAEQRGQGKSEGSRMSFGVAERHDCLSWCEWANCRLPETLPIYLAGISMGAATVLMAAGLDLPSNVCGIIADCGFTSPHEIWKHVAEQNLHLRYRLRGRHADHLCRKNLHFSANMFSTVDALHQAKIPVLLIHGEKDHFVPHKMSERNFQACASPCRLKLIKNADHGMSYYMDPQAYQQTLLDFFEDYDPPKAPKRL